MFKQLIENLKAVNDVDTLKTLCFLETATLDLVAQRALTTIWKDGEILETLAEHKLYVGKLKEKSLALDFEEHNVLIQLHGFLEEIERDCINVRTALCNKENAKQFLANVSFNTLKSFIVAPIDDKNTNDWLLPIICEVIEQQTHTKEFFAEYAIQVTEMLSHVPHVLKDTLSYEHYIVVRRSLAVVKAFVVSSKSMEDPTMDDLRGNLNAVLLLLNALLGKVGEIFNAENLEKALSLHSQLPSNMQNEKEVTRHFEAMSA